MTRPKRRQSRAEQRRSSEQRKGFLKIGIGVAIIVGFGAAYFAAASGRKELDEVTLCPETPSSLTVLVVDVTDPMNRPQQQDFANQLATLKNSVPRYGELSVMRVDSTGSQLLEPVITRCSPGTAHDTDELRGNPQKIQRQWVSGFSQPLDEAFQSLMQASGADRSPIMESVQSVALTVFQKPGREDLPKRLIVASDLLQHTGEISFYHRIPSAAEFVQSDAFRRVRTDLSGVEVELWQLQRLDSSRTQPRALSLLWEQAVQEQGGSVSRIYNVSG